MVSRLFLSIILTVSSVANAAEIFLCELTNDVDLGAKYNLLLETDDNDEVIALINQKVGAYRSRYPLAMLNEGAVVKRSGDHKVVILQSSSFDSFSGGIINVRYLYNGMTKSYEQFQLLLSRENNGTNLTISHYDQIYRVNKLHFVSRKFLGKVVGIEKVRLNNLTLPIQATEVN